MIHFVKKNIEIIMNSSQHIFIIGFLILVIEGLLLFIKKNILLSINSQI
jgi:hypothetical protein